MRRGISKLIESGAERITRRVLVVVLVVSGVSAMTYPRSALQQLPITANPPISLNTPWSKDEFRGIRFPRTYCRSSQQPDCLANGHGGGLWGAVDFFVAPEGDEQFGCWKVLAAHSGVAQVGSDSDVTVTSGELRVKTKYDHVVPPAWRVKRVEAGEFLGTVLTGEQGELNSESSRHLMFSVYKMVADEWPRVDLRYVELDGQPIFQCPFTNPPREGECSGGRGRWDGRTGDQVWDDAIGQDSIRALEARRDHFQRILLEEPSQKPAALRAIRELDRQIASAKAEIERAKAGRCDR